MSTHVQFYLTCNRCGEQFIGSDGERYGETEGEVRGIAEDEGWSCGVPTPNGSDLDFCGKCRKRSEIMHPAAKIKTLKTLKATLEACLEIAEDIEETELGRSISFLACERELNDALGHQGDESWNAMIEEVAALKAAHGAGFLKVVEAAKNAMLLGPNHQLRPWREEQLQEALDVWENKMQSKELR